MLYLVIFLSTTIFIAIIISIYYIIIKRRLKVSEITNILPLCITALGPEFKESLILKKEPLIFKNNTKFTQLLFNYLNNPTYNNNYKLSKIIYKRLHHDSLTLPSRVVLVIMKSILCEQTDRNFFREKVFSEQELLLLRNKAPFFFYYCAFRKVKGDYNVHWVVCDTKEETNQNFINLTKLCENLILPNKLVIFFTKSNSSYSFNFNNIDKNLLDIRCLIIHQPSGYLLFGGRKILNLEKSLLKSENFTKNTKFISLAVIKNK